MLQKIFVPLLLHVCMGGGASYWPVYYAKNFGPKIDFSGRLTLDRPVQGVQLGLPSHLIRVFKYIPPLQGRSQ